MPRSPVQIMDLITNGDHMEKILMDLGSIIRT